MDLQSFSSWLFMLILLILIPVGFGDEAGNDRDALLAFKRNISRDYENCTQSWDAGLINACTWFHVTCDKSNRVDGLYLGGCNMIVSLVPELGKLTMLTTMLLHTNDLQGSIPPQLGNLVNLKSLYLNDNFLDGEIPKELGNLKNLKFLDLSFNNLNGVVPEELSQNFQGMIVDLTMNKGPGGQGGLTGPCTQVPC